MAMTLEEFVAKSGAEMVGGKLVVGIQSERIVVGTTDPTFTLNEEGQELLADLEAGDTAEEAVADISSLRKIKENGAAAANASIARKPRGKAATPAAPVEPEVPAVNVMTPEAIAAEAARIAADAAAATAAASGQ